MSRFGWSRLFPKPWRAKYGDEFDATIELAKLSAFDVIDILGHAAREQVKCRGPQALLLLGWVLVAFLNLVAKEVQWAAGALLLVTAIGTAFRPRRWAHYAFWFTSSIPVSSLYFYQIPGIHHEPLYKTAVALIPATVGAILGLVVRFTLGGSSGDVAR